METTSAASAASIPLPPLPARGTRAPLPRGDDFKSLLATQGIAAPESGKPSDAEARIMAAQIASKANVNAGVKREPVLAGIAGRDDQSHRSLSFRSARGVAEPGRRHPGRRRRAALVQ